MTTSALEGQQLMTKPVVFAIDDEPDVLRAVEIDLRHEFGAEYRILRADSGASALESLKQLKVRNEPAALFLVDQRMPNMTGVEFLEQAIKLFPDAKRALLTAYADTDAAIRAINEVGIDYYLLKPWDPPEENLYPVLHDLLDDWLTTFRPPFEGVRVIDHRWSPHSHEIRDFLARNHVPYRWLDLDTSEDARGLFEQVAVDKPQLPLLMFPDGSYLMNPTNAGVAEKIGLRTQPLMPFYDLVIIGAGPAGLAAAVYGASEGLRTVMVEKVAPGGQAGTSSRIENYLGFPVGLSGADLARRGADQAKRFGVEILTPQEAAGIHAEGAYRVVTLADGTQLSGHTVIIATGVSYHRLDVPGLDRLTGVGVYYGAARSEAAICQGQDVFIVGAGNSAGQAAMYFSKYARAVTLLVRSDSLAQSMSRYLINYIEATPNIHVRLETVVTEVMGSDHLEAVTICNTCTGEIEILEAPALFIFIGANPHTDWLAGVVARDKYGYILSGHFLSRAEGGNSSRPLRWPLDREPFLFETTLPGVFVIGDARHGSVKRVATAVGEGAMVVQFVHQYLGGL